MLLKYENKHEIYIRVMQDTTILIHWKGKKISGDEFERVR